MAASISGGSLRISRTNTFAPLLEEASVRKQQRARERRKIRVTQTESKTPKSPTGVMTGASWADILDESDDEANNIYANNNNSSLPNHLADDLANYLSSDEEEIPEEEEQPVIKNYSDKNKMGNVINNHKEPNISVASVPAKTTVVLSKKEQNQMELDELAAILNEVGLANPAEKPKSIIPVLNKAVVVPKTASKKIAKAIVVPIANPAVETQTTSSQQTSSQQTSSQQTSSQQTSSQQTSSQPTSVLSREEAVIAARKALLNKKKQPATPIVAKIDDEVQASVIADAKKKAEAKKTKTKRDKYLFDR